ncbi:hypothetical protein [Rhodopseudomonas palustris]|nr:hypothetical protein [Rhodopseudomonas palustris]
MSDEQPQRGGSYIRQPDGSLKRAEPPAVQPEPASASSQPLKRSKAEK